MPLFTQNAPRSDEAYLPGLIAPPSGAIETFPRGISPLANASVLTSAQLFCVSIGLPAGRLVTSISFVSATTAVSAGVNQWFALFDSSRNRLAVTADDTSTAWSGSSIKTLFIARQVTDATITSGAATVTSATAAFTAADTGQQAIFIGAGAAGAPLGSSAVPVTMTYVNATTVTLSTNASTTVASGGTLYIGTPYTTTNSTPTQFYLGIMVKATVPTLSCVVGAVGASTVNGTAPKLNGTSTGSLTDPSTCPNPAASLGSIASHPYAYVT